MRLEVKDNCPLNKFKPCKQFECAWFVQMRGNNPNTGEEVDEHSCAIAWLPVLLIENATQARGTSAAVESFRNEMVKGSKDSQKMLLAATQLTTGRPEDMMKLINGNEDD